MKIGKIKYPSNSLLEGKVNIPLAPFQKGEPKKAPSRRGWGCPGFTLVELIVVITILAILSTIGFVAYSGYLAGTRDTNRIAQLKSISDGLEMYRTRHDLPYPDDYVKVTASGETIAYQGYLGKNVLETIEYTSEGKDPKDGTYFSYYLTKDKRYYQLMAYLEEADNLQAFAPLSPPLKGGTIKVSAIDYTTRYPTVYGKKLGILTDTENTPIQEVEEVVNSGYLDIVNTNSGFIARLSDTEKISEIKDLYLYNNFLDKNKLKNNSDFLGYWFFNDRNKGKDFSKNNNSFLTNSGVVFGDSAFFDKAGETYLEANNITLGNDFTILVKLKVRDHTGWSRNCHNTNIIGQHANGGCSTTAWGLGFSNHSSSSSLERHIIFNYGDGSNWLTLKSSKQYEIGRDLFIVFVKKADKYYMYVNGKLDSTGDIENMQNNSYNLRVGGTDGYFFDGNIYYGAIVNKAISEDLVKILSNSDNLWKIK